jgi:hypothetical protein
VRSPLSEQSAQYPSKWLTMSEHFSDLSHWKAKALTASRRAGQELPEKPSPSIFLAMGMGKTTMQLASLPTPSTNSVASCK